VPVKLNGRPVGIPDGTLKGDRVAVGRFIECISIYSHNISRNVKVCHHTAFHDPLVVGDLGEHVVVGGVLKRTSHRHLLADDDGTGGVGNVRSGAEELEVCPVHGHGIGVVGIAGGHGHGAGVPVIVRQGDVDVAIGVAVDPADLYGRIRHGLAGSPTGDGGVELEEVGHRAVGAGAGPEPGIGGDFDTLIKITRIAVRRLLSANHECVLISKRERVVSRAWKTHIGDHCRVPIGHVGAIGYISHPAIIDPPFIGHPGPVQT